VLFKGDWEGQTEICPFLLPLKLTPKEGYLPAKGG